MFMRPGHQISRPSRPQEGEIICIKKRTRSVVEKEGSA